MWGAVRSDGAVGAQYANGRGLCYETSGSSTWVGKPNSGTDRNSRAPSQPRVGA